MLNDIELLLKDGATGNADVIDKSDIEERVANANVGLEYAGALPVYVLASAKAVNVYVGRLASISESKLTNVTAVKEGTTGGTAAIDKLDIVGAVPKANTGSI